jgi:Carboxypeptidase regulatory-like domain
LKLLAQTPEAKPIMKMPSSEKHQRHEFLQFFRMVLLKAVLISGVMAALFAGRLSAQVLYGGLVGNVTDPTGALVPNAEVRARNLDTGAVLQTTTGNTGNFAIGNVPPGRFEVTITKEGFGTFKVPSVSVEMNTQARIDAALQVGNTNSSFLSRTM